MTKYLAPLQSAVILSLISLLISPVARADDPLTLQWIRQFGTPGSDNISWLSLGATGSIHLSGYTTGALGGSNAGDADGWLATYTSTGQQLWLQQFGTTATEYANGVTADWQGNLYVSGGTEGSLGRPQFGARDVFVVKYSAAGDQLWSRQLGTSSWDDGQRPSVDSLGNVYIAGSTKGDLAGPPNIPENGFLAKYDSAGEQVWIRQREMGSSAFQGVVAGGAGQVYVSGTGDTGTARFHGAILSNYDDLGNLHWTRYVASDSGATFGRDVSADALGNVYIAGESYGDLAGANQGVTDVFLTKFNDRGDLLWTRQLGTTGNDGASSVFPDGFGNVYIAGYLERTLNVRPSDAFVAKYNGAGDLLWMQRIAADAVISSVAADHSGNVYVAGRSGGDVFLAKYSGLTVPEPSGAVILSLGAALSPLFAARSSSRRRK